MNKHLLVISKNYWGVNMAEETSLKFLEKFSEIVKIPDDNITTLIGNDVTLQNVKTTIYDKVVNIVNHTDNVDNKLYIYMNGHGNQVDDINNDENALVLESETTKDLQDEVYQLPDGNLVDDDLTTIINEASKTGPNKLFVVLISDHCSSGSMLDNNIKLNFDFVTYGSCYDNADSYISGEGNVMTINFLSVLEKCKDVIQECTTMSFYRLLDREMSESWIGSIQRVTLHVSSHQIFVSRLFN